MERKRSIYPVSAVLLVYVLLGLAAKPVAAGGYFLIDGVGLEGEIQIGLPAPKNAKPTGDQEGWYGIDKLPLYFKKTAEGRVAVIRCDRLCLTNRGITIGSGVKDVMLSYSTPSEEKRINKKKFLTYNGAGFLLNEKGDAVETIYIFPPGFGAKAN